MPSARPSAIKQYSIFDGTATGISFFGLSIPTFFFGLILQIVLVLQWNVWFGDGSTPFFTSRMNSPGWTAFGWDRLMNILPALTVAVQSLAVYSRYMRSSTAETLGSDYLRTARAKGDPGATGRGAPRHAQRPHPLTTLAAIDIGAIVGGLVITEAIFEWPGMGQYFLTALRDGDYIRVLPWMMVVVFFAIAAQPGGRHPLQRPRPPDPL